MVGHRKSVIFRAWRKAREGQSAVAVVEAAVTKHERARRQIDRFDLQDIRKFVKQKSLNAKTRDGLGRRRWGCFPKVSYTCSASSTSKSVLFCRRCQQLDFGYVHVVDFCGGERSASDGRNREDCNITLQLVQSFSDETTNPPRRNFVKRALSV